mmetsp:Transcript_34817/g.60727  ORF Transcript_34817/g.60727 Transcript_34817/m.60727 type:complete len:82 (-) Transcript_34817:713-958(-)
MHICYDFMNLGRKYFFVMIHHSSLHHHFLQGVNKQSSCGNAGPFLSILSTMIVVTGLTFCFLLLLPFFSLALLNNKQQHLQ